MPDKKNIPAHVAIIMDGNGRWAKERGLPRIEGHRQGIKRVKEVLKTASDSGVKFLTLYAFSSENWKRPAGEVNMLMRALDDFLRRNLKELKKNNMRLKVMGRQYPIPRYVLKRLAHSLEETKANTGLTVNLAFNYGSRQEITDAVKKAVKEISEKRISLEELDEEKFGEFLYTRGIPDPDLLIRTSGEMRISNFLLWQISYAELYFPKVYWPDFKAQNFEEALSEYDKRVRRFGGL